MRGVVNVRGAAVPVVDLAQKLGLGEVKRTINTRIVIMSRSAEEVNTFYLFDIQGKQVFVFSQGKMNKNSDLSNREYIQAALAGKEGYSTTPTKSIATGKLIVSVTAPVMDEKGNVVGGVGMPQRKPVGKINLRSLEVLHQVLRRINDAVLASISRKGYFKALSNELRRLFPYDRLAINLYDSDIEILTYFTTADGVVVGTQSSVRQAGPQTVAGLAITSREPVVIRDLARQFKSADDNPLAEAGLHTSIAFPLIVRDTVLGTLHCSFRQEPANLMAIRNRKTAEET